MARETGVELLGIRGFCVELKEQDHLNGPAVMLAKYLYSIELLVHCKSKGQE